LTVSIRNQTTALCIDVRLPCDVSLCISSRLLQIFSLCWSYVGIHAEYKRILMRVGAMLHIS